MSDLTGTPGSGESITVSPDEIRVAAQALDSIGPALVELVAPTNRAVNTFGRAGVSDSLLEALEAFSVRWNPALTRLGDESQLVSDRLRKAAEQYVAADSAALGGGDGASS